MVGEIWGGHFSFSLSLFNCYVRWKFKANRDSISWSPPRSRNTARCVQLRSCKCLSCCLQSSRRAEQIQSQNAREQIDQNIFFKIIFNAFWTIVFADITVPPLTFLQSQLSQSKKKIYKELFSFTQPHHSFLSSFYLKFPHVTNIPSSGSRNQFSSPPPQVNRIHHPSITFQNAADR